MNTPFKSRLKSALLPAALMAFAGVASAQTTLIHGEAGPIAAPVPPRCNGSPIPLERPRAAI